MAGDEEDACSASVRCGRTLARIGFIGLGFKQARYRGAVLGTKILFGIFSNKINVCWRSCQSNRKLSPANRAGAGGVAPQVAMLLHSANAAERRSL